jgi:hypothetical protein
MDKYTLLKSQLFNGYWCFSHIDARVDKSDLEQKGAPTNAGAPCEFVRPEITS